MSERRLALLRGINVGGNALVSMSALRSTFERIGARDVVTWLNTGNVVFVGDLGVSEIERAIAEDCGFPVAVLLRERVAVDAVVEGIPPAWYATRDDRCEVLFLAAADDRPDVVEQIPVNPDVEEVRYAPGAVVWHLDRKRYAKSRMNRLVGTDLYRRMTMRSVGTVRKLRELLRPT